MHKLQHTQSCIRLCGEANPVTVSGNLSLLASCNLGSAETESPLSLSLFSVSVLIFYLNRHTVLVTGILYQCLTRVPPDNPPNGHPSAVDDRKHCTHLYNTHTHNHSWYERLRWKNQDKFVAEGFVQTLHSAPPLVSQLPAGWSGTERVHYVFRWNINAFFWLHIKANLWDVQESSTTGKIIK